jgi:hypothetical protein
MKQAGRSSDDPHKSEPKARPVRIVLAEPSEGVNIVITKLR